MESKNNYRFKKADFIPYFGWGDYRRRTKAPIIEEPKACLRENLLALYNVGMFLGTSVLVFKGIEKLLN